MTKEEYYNLPRFEVDKSIDFETYTKDLRFSKDSIFKLMDMHGKIRYIKITYNFHDLFFDLKECNVNGKVIRSGLKAIEKTPSFIKNLIYEGRLAYL